MEHLPIYIVFVLTALLTLAMLYKATVSIKAIIIVSVWLIVQAAISLTGFYTVSTGVPPRFALLLMPPIIFILMLLFTRLGKSLLDRVNIKALTLLHVIRIPVEVVLYWLFLHKAIPQVMTFEGRNFDILCGITAPLIYYFGFVKPVINRKVLIAWNIICLLLLINIAATAVLSAPFRFQQFGFGQPNIALFYFPFVWLPCFLVPAVFFAHLATLRRLIKG